MKQTVIGLFLITMLKIGVVNLAAWAFIAWFLKKHRDSQLRNDFYSKRKFHKLVRLITWFYLAIELVLHNAFYSHGLLAFWEAIYYYIVSLTVAHLSFNTPDNFDMLTGYAKAFREFALVSIQSFLNIFKPISNEEE